MIDVGGGKRSGSNDGFNEIGRVTTEAVTNGRNVGERKRQHDGRRVRQEIYYIPLCGGGAGDGRESGKHLGEKNNKLKCSRKEKKFKAPGIKANIQKKINNRACAAQRILIDSARRHGR